MSGQRENKDGTLVIEIASPLRTAFLAMVGIFAALALLAAVCLLVLRPEVNSEQVRAACAHHGGVEHLGEGTSFMEGMTFVTCRDGWFERVDN